MDSSEKFKTPAKPREARRESKSWEEVVIPQSPALRVLGYGTGIRVSLLERVTPRRLTVRSPWAVKRLSRRCPIQPSHAARLRREAEVLRRLRHPHVVGYRGVAPGPVDGTVSLLMEAAPASLLDLIESRAETADHLLPFPLHQIAVVGEDVASALHYLHSDQHILHGDMKSANVLVFGQFRAAKVCDFGVCLPLDRHLVVSEPRQFYVGTEPWSAPEAVHDDTISHKTDIYSYALTLWEMFAMELPHASELADSSSELSSSDDSDCSRSYFGDVLGVAPAVPQYSPSVMEEYREFVQIYTVCSSARACDRPSAQQCLDLFRPLRSPAVQAGPSSSGSGVGQQELGLQQRSPPVRVVSSDDSSGQPATEGSPVRAVSSDDSSGPPAIEGSPAPVAQRQTSGAAPPCLSQPDGKAGGTYTRPLRAEGEVAPESKENQSAAATQFHSGSVKRQGLSPEKKSPKRACVEPKGARWMGSAVCDRPVRRSGRERRPAQALRDATNQ